MQRVSANLWKPRMQRFGFLLLSICDRKALNLVSAPKHWYAFIRIVWYNLCLTNGCQIEAENSKHFVLHHDRLKIKVKKYPFFFLKIVEDMSPFWGHWYPYFGLLVMSPLGFKARVGSALFELSGGICVTLHVPWDSPLVRHWSTSWWPAWQLSRLFYIPARHWWDSKPGAIMPPLTVWDQAGQTLYRLNHPGSAG